MSEKISGLKNGINEKIEIINESTENYIKNVPNIGKGSYKPNVHRNSEIQKKMEEHRKFLNSIVKS